MAVASDSILFNTLSTKFSQLLFGRTEGDRILVGKLLDDLNSLDYRHPVVTNDTRAILLVNQCCTLVPTDDVELVAKSCQLITSLVSRQHVQIEGRTLAITVQWCLHALRQMESSITADVLATVDALFRSGAQNLHALVPEVVSSNGPIVLLAEKDSSPETLLLSTQCLEACTIVPEELRKSDDYCSLHLKICSQIFMKYLTADRKSAFADLIYYKLLTSCLRGLQNVIQQNQDYLYKQLEILLGIVKSYMVYGIKGVDFIKPQKVMPSPLSIPEPPANPLRERKGGKMTKQRKHRTSGSGKKDSRKSETSIERNSDSQLYEYVPATMSLTTSNDNGSTPYGCKLRTSDSDFSDSEGGKVAKLGIMEGRLRQAALSLFLNLVKFTDKRTMFSYWSNFIPDGSPAGQHSLAICILKDPSSRGRMAALNVLLALLSSSKLYLSQAENTDRNTSFTSFSAALGSMIQELHRCLRLALNENSIPVLTQVLKCFAALIQATPYHRLSPGIITKIIRNVKGLMSHRDASVQVTALIVLGCILASEPVVTETKEALLKNLPIKQTDDGQADESTSETNLSTALDPDFEYVGFSSDEEGPEPSQSNAGVPWLLQKCLENLGVALNSSAKADCACSDVVVPAPVKLESLQVISAMTRNYFTSLMAPNLSYISKALEISLADKYTDLRLHAGRTVDFIGQAMNQYFNNDPAKSELSIEQGLGFWGNVHAPLVQLVQDQQHPTLRAVGCDCLGSVGPNIFEHLSSDKQMLIMMLLLACSRDEENSVKGAAVRALAISVMYPTLRDDTGFIIDTAETIYRTLEDPNLSVRIKASWSLGNLSDALVLSKNESSAIEEIPDHFLLQLIEAGVQGSNDNDKIKTNAVRALGNLLQLVTVDLMKDPKFSETSLRGIFSLVSNSANGSNMKVRWNACYALGSILKNDALYQTAANWQSAVFGHLTDLVIGFRNFKVRINAALALSCPTSRKHYGQYYYLTWNSLLKALENSQNMEDFSEYKHRDHLVEQICLSFGQLATFLEPDDLSALQDTFVFYTDVVKTHMSRVYERLVPEKTGILFNAATHIKNLKVENLSGEHREILDALDKIFSNNL